MLQFLSAVIFFASIFIIVLHLPLDLQITRDVKAL